MIYLFTGNNRYLIQQEAQKWKGAFTEKYGVENFLHIISLQQISNEDLLQSLVLRSLFSEKRLVIIDGYPYSGEKNFSGASEKEKTILENLNNINPETIVVFLSENPDKRKSGYKTLSKMGEVKEFSLSSDEQVFDIVNKKYGNKVDTDALRKLIFFKGGNLEKTLSEIQKLSILHENISVQTIENIIIPEFEESIFVFIDTLLSKNKKKIFSELNILLQYSNLYALYQSIIANIRVFLYIHYLKSQRKRDNEIGDILKLGNRQFLINKQCSSSFSEIKSLYVNLLDFDKNMKFGRFVSSDEEDIKYELEKVLIKFAQ